LIKFLTVAILVLGVLLGVFFINLVENLKFVLILEFRDHVQDVLVL